MFDTPFLIEMAQKSKEPTGVKLLDDLFDAYNECTDPKVIDVPNYYRFLFWLSKAKPGLTFVELGCKYGVASLHFLYGGGKRAVAVDHGEHFRKTPFENLVMVETEKSWEFVLGKSTSDRALSRATWLGRPDIVMIDTDHSYNTTREEFALWSKWVATGGIILFDDVGAWGAFGREDFACGRFFEELPGRKLVLNDLHEGGWGFGIWMGK